MLQKKATSYLNAVLDQEDIIHSSTEMHLPTESQQGRVTGSDSHAVYKHHTEDAWRSDASHTMNMLEM
jgi:hypothetical protein